MVVQSASKVTQHQSATQNNFCYHADQLTTLLVVQPSGLLVVQSASKVAQHQSAAQNNFCYHADQQTTLLVVQPSGLLVVQSASKVAQHQSAAQNNFCYYVSWLYSRVACWLARLLVDWLDDVFDAFLSIPFYYSDSLATRRNFCTSCSHLLAEGLPQQALPYTFENPLF